MKKYSYKWSEKKPIESICVRENNKQVADIPFLYDDFDSLFLEYFSDDGNFIMSNKYAIDTGPYTYRHYTIREDNGKYIIVKGKQWNDGLWRFFHKKADGILEVTMCHDRSITLYDCVTFKEYQEMEKPVVRTRKR